MNRITLAQAEALHLRIGNAALSAGLRAHYVGALAYPVREGLAPPIRTAVWAIVRPEPDTPPEQNGLETAVELLFELSIDFAGAGSGAEILDIAVTGTPISLRVRQAAAFDRASLDRFKAAVGGDQGRP